MNGPRRHDLTVRITVEVALASVSHGEGVVGVDLAVDTGRVWQIPDLERVGRTDLDAAETDRHDAAGCVLGIFRRAPGDEPWRSGGIRTGWLPWGADFIS